MKVTMMTKEFYMPMCMSSGRDAILVGYGGSNFVSLNGHKSTEAHQGAPCGWYKSATRHPDEYMQTCVMAGVQVQLYGAAIVPRSYEQEFFPERATLVTTLEFRAGIKLRITSFFTYDESIWGEKLEVVECPEDISPKIGFRVSRPFLSERLTFVRKSEVSFSRISDSELEVGYTLGDFTGRGRLIAGRPFDSYKESEGKFADQCYAEGMYEDVKAGFEATRVMFLLDEREKHTTFEELNKRVSLGYDRLYDEHISFWDRYFSTVTVKTGLEELDYEFLFSRYLVKAHQHPDSGIVTLGMLPHHWKGAASCAWDEEFAHEAELVTGNFTESSHFTEQYKRQAPDGYEILKKRGIPGLSFTGWNTMDGKFCGHRPIEEWITTFKPMFCAYSINAIYNEWKYNPSFDVEAYREICCDVLKFSLHSLVRQGEDGMYYLTEVRDGMETGVIVSVDTSTTLIFAKAFLYVGEMYGIEKYREIGESMMKTLDGNRRPDGLLSSARGFPYTASHIEFYRSTYAYGLTPPELLENVLAELKTPWGYDSQVATEEKRHWPWYRTWAARSFTVAKMPKQAASHIARLCDGRSSLGALPEYIRLDGCGINYYYTSPHALVVTAVCEACAVMRGNELLICYGFDSEAREVTARDIRVEGGASVSFTVSGGALRSLSLKNDTGMPISLRLSVNSLISHPALPLLVTVDGNSEIKVV